MEMYIFPFGRASSVYGRIKARSSRTFKFTKHFSGRTECPVCFVFVRTIFLRGKNDVKYQWFPVLNY